LMVRYKHPRDFTLPNMLEIAAFALVVWLITGWIFGSILWRRRQKLSQDRSSS
jgi:ABC-type dipeptide/oligopeptide/nickel transport system permease component